MRAGGGSRSEGGAAPKRSRWFVYVLRCHDGTLYTGIARDVAARVRMHESGRGAKYTRGRGPFQVLCTWTFMSQGAALKHELAVKALGKGAKGELIAARARVVSDRAAGHRRALGTESTGERTPPRPSASPARARTRSPRGSDG